MIKAFLHSGARLIVWFHLSTTYKRRSQNYWLSTKLWIELVSRFATICFVSISYVSSNIHLLRNNQKLNHVEKNNYTTFFTVRYWVAALYLLSWRNRGIDTKLENWFANLSKPWNFTQRASCQWEFCLWVGWQFEFPILSFVWVSVLLALIRVFLMKMSHIIVEIIRIFLLGSFEYGLLYYFYNCYYLLVILVWRQHAVCFDSDCLVSLAIIKFKINHFAGKVVYDQHSSLVWIAMCVWIEKHCMFQLCMLVVLKIIHFSKTQIVLHILNVLI